MNSGAAPEESALRPACVSPDACTLVRPVARAAGVESVAFSDRPPLRVDPSQPFAGWLPWLHAPEGLRTRAWHGESVRIERVTEAGTFLLRVVPSVRVAEEPEALLVQLLVDPLRTGTPAPLPEAIAIARERKLLSPEQERQAERESQAQRGRVRALTDAWLAFARSPAERSARARLLDSIGNEASALQTATFLTPAQRTALRQAGLALEGRILLEDGGQPAVAFRLRVEAVPLEQVAREWNAGLRALVNPLERVPRPLLLVAPGHRHEEVSFTLDVLEGDQDRMSQVARRLLAVPGLSTDGKQLPPPAL
jgi:hypothetical protein